MRALFVTILAVLVVRQMETSGQTIKVDVTLQQVTATVTDSSGNLLTTLQPEDFVVEVDGIRQQIAHFSRDSNVPFSVGVVLDTSSSMAKTVFAAKSAVSTFITGMHPRDESFLMTFDINPTIRQGFTHQPTKLFDALQSVSIGGGTALTESVTQAAKKMQQASNRKHALIVISDGGDIFATRSNLHPFLKQIPEMETLIYSIHMVDRNVTKAINTNARATSTQTLPRNTAAFQPDLAAELMQSIAKESGGRYFHLDMEDSPTEMSRQLNGAFKEIFAELRAQYTIGFYPPAGVSSSTSVQVRTVNPAYQVRATAPQSGRPVITDDDPYETALNTATEAEQEDRHEAAIQAFEHAAGLNDSDPRAFRALGRLYVEAKQFSKAVEALNVLGSLTLLTGNDHFILGTALLGLDNVAAAQEQLVRSIALTPDDAQAYLALYTADMKLNKSAEALSALDTFLKRFPNDPKYAELLEQANKLRSTLKPLR